ncbi:DMT family transporter [Aestuariibacter sp. AA17]|uniref:DMT family transporter n=1 Tax=Fluctibacter corallii TaxID=2984329 RepID=A0ABT3AB87_9ALTE|nr:DMT family transporter [Aestuariibacter sp. AA17]MCV2885938.1 DMT family transporter [Aestuariibacter sp. AA17]
MLSEVLFAGVGALVKHLSTDLTQAQLVFFRNVFAFMFLLPWVFRVGVSGLKTSYPGLHLFRSITGLIAMYCFFQVLANMPLAPAMMALLTAPFLVPIVARIWLKEHISRITGIAILVGFVGVTLVLEPDKTDFNIYIWLALICACLVAVNKCSIRKLSGTEPSARIVFYFSGIASVVSFFPMLFDWTPISTASWLALITMGLFATIGQLFMTKAFQLASPVKIGLLTYSSVIFAAILGYVFWQEPVSAGLILGTVLIIFAANMTIRQRWL